MVQKQAVQVDLRGMDQHSGAKRLAPGRAALMQNVRQRLRGVYGKRDGHSQIATAGVGSLGLAVASGRLTSRGQAGIVIYDQGSNEWLKRGQSSPCVATSSPAMSTSANAWKPCQITASGYTYFFAGIAPTTAPVATHLTTPLSYVYRIVDAGGAEILKETTIAGAAGYSAKPVVAGGFVWLFLGADVVSATNRTLYAVKFDPANPTHAPVVTTYEDAGSSQWIVNFDVMQLAAGGAAVAVLRYNTSGGTSFLDLSLLNTATGLPLVSPGIVTLTHATITVDNSASRDYNLQFLKNANPDGNGRYYLIGRNVANAWWGCTITASTLAFFTNPTVLAAAGAETMACGYLDGTGKPQIYSCTPGSTPSTSKVTQSVFTSAWGASSTGVLRRHCNLVSEPIQVVNGLGLSEWFVVVQHDDRDGATASFQRAYYIVGSDVVATFGVWGRVLYGLGGDALQHAYLGSPTAKGQSWICPMGDTSQTLSVVRLAANAYDGTSYTTSTLTFDFGQTLASGLGPPVVGMSGQTAVFPGGWPAFISGAANAVEWPGMFPQKTAVSASAPGVGFALAAGVYSVAVCYVYRDRISGNVIRSAPSATATATMNGTTQALQVDVPSLSLTNTSAGDFLIEIYVSPVGSAVLYRQAPVSNDPTVDTITATFNSGGTGMVIPVTGTEILYTASGELANDPPPPCQTAAQWHNRVFLANSEALGEIWPSKEVVSGHGLEFSGGLIFSVPGDTGPVTAMSPLDQNWFLLFKRDAIFAIQGAGPAADGSGATYEPIRLGGNFGTIAPGSVVQTRHGVFFQGLDGRLYLVDGGLTVTPVYDGTYSYTGTITAAVSCPALQQVRFYLATAAADGTYCLILDYTNANADNPMGEWLADTTGGAPTAIGDGGACLYGNLPVFAHGKTQASTVWTEVLGQFFDGTSTPILRKVQLPIVLSGVRGYQRLYRGQIVGQFKTAHSLKVTVDTFDGAAGESGSATETWTKAVSTGPELFEFRPTRGRLSAFTVTVEDTGTDLTEGGTLDGVAFVVGVKQGLPRVGSGQRL